MLKIRLYRRGRKNAACFDVVVAEAKKKKFIEKVGYYNPRLKTDNRIEKFTLKLDRISYWKSQGAQPTEVMENILKKIAAQTSGI
jgi:small subunit ribosomal protein S16